MKNYYIILFLFALSGCSVLQPTGGRSERSALTDTEEIAKLKASLQSLAVRYYKDSVTQWAAIRKLQLVPVPNLQPLTLRHIKDSIRQWLAIGKLQAASPVLQIPIMQADIKAIKSKNVAQDKTSTGLQTQVTENQAYAVFEIGEVWIQTDSLKNLIIKYATKVNLNHFRITGGVISIPILDSLQTRVTKLEAMKPPGGQIK